MIKTIVMVHLGLAVSPYCFASQSTTHIECDEVVQAMEAQSTLSISQRDDGKASVVLKDQKGLTHLEGTYRLVDNSFFSKVYQYDLADESGSKTPLQVSWHTIIGRAGCGRGGCPGGFTSIEASMHVAGKEVAFTCHENLN